MAARNFAVKFSPAVHELRLHLCQSSTASKGVRDFLEAGYVDLKKANPTLPILVRECSGTLPKAWARYDRGVEASVSLEGLSASQVVDNLSQLNKP